METKEVTNTAIIIPTYNAAEEIVESIRGIQKVVPDASIFIVDDNSPDGTAKKVKEAFDDQSTIHLLSRKGKGGRGSAVIYGFKHALKSSHFKYFIEMDADLCHNPRYIPILVKKNQKWDVVIASKYLHGSTIAGYPLKRKIMSRCMNFGARIILGVPISDYSNGYRCYSRRVVEFLVKQKFTSKGFVVLSEVVFKSYKKGFTVTEIPFNFKQVATGKSNFSMHEIRETIWTLLKLRFE